MADSSAVCGMCIRGSDVGVYAPDDPIAYVHPCCPEHGDRHEFKWNGKIHNTHDGPLRWCECGAYEDEHGGDA